MTNHLFREVLDGTIPLPARRTREDRILDVIWQTVAVTGAAFEEMAEVIRKVTEALQAANIIETPPPNGPRERALWARQRRNTGPAPANLTQRGRVTHYKTM